MYVDDQDEALAFCVGVDFGSVDAGFRDPAGHGWKMIQAPGKCARAMGG